MTVPEYIETQGYAMPSGTDDTFHSIRSEWRHDFDGEDVVNMFNEDEKTKFSALPFEQQWEVVCFFMRLYDDTRAATKEQSSIGPHELH